MAAQPTEEKRMPLPYVTEDLPGVGGRLRARVEDFIVEEIPLYEPCGEGEHIYVRLTREGWATRDLQKKLAKLFAVPVSSIGVAGMKDKHARVSQTFSLHLHHAAEGEVSARIESSLPVTVQWARRHRNKLKMGHLLGNRFSVIIETDPALLPRAEAVADVLRREAPNFFGQQRFGTRGDNAVRGRQCLQGRGPRDRWLRRLLLSAYQAELFNRWLTDRIHRGWFDRIVAGDVAKVIGSGGLFLVEDETAEQSRFTRGEIIFTGPLFGAKMMPAQGEPGRMESALLASEGITTNQLRQARLQGSRRPGRIRVEDLTVEAVERGLRLDFALPKGAFATTVLREVMKSEEDSAAQDQS